MGLPVRRRNNPILHFEFRLISDAPGSEICGLGIRFQLCLKVGTALLTIVEWLRLSLLMEYRSCNWIMLVNEVRHKWKCQCSLAEYFSFVSSVQRNSPLIADWYKVTFPYLNRLLCFHHLNSESVRVPDCGEEGRGSSKSAMRVGGIGRPEVDDSHPLLLLRAVIICSAVSQRRLCHAGSGEGLAKQWQAQPSKIIPLLRRTRSKVMENIGHIRYKQ